MPGLVNEGGQCQPTGPKRRHLLSLSRVATAVAWALSAVRKQDFGSRIAGSFHQSTESGQATRFTQSFRAVPLRH